MRTVSMQVFLQAYACTEVVLSGLQKRKQALKLLYKHTSALKARALTQTQMQKGRSAHSQTPGARRALSRSWLPSEYATGFSSFRGVASQSAECSIGLSEEFSLPLRLLLINVFLETVFSSFSQCLESWTGRALVLMHEACRLASFAEPTITCMETSTCPSMRH